MISPSSGDSGRGGSGKSLSGSGSFCGAGCRGGGQIPAIAACDWGAVAVGRGGRDAPPAGRMGGAAAAAVNEAPGGTVPAPPPAIGLPTRLSGCQMGGTWQRSAYSRQSCSISWWAARAFAVWPSAAVACAVCPATLAAAITPDGATGSMSNATFQNCWNCIALSCCSGCGSGGAWRSWCACCHVQNS